MILPTIHINGTSASDLQHGYDEAARASHQLELALATLEFNARDYYVQGPDVWPKAQEQHVAIRTKAKEISNYIQAIREHLYA